MATATATATATAQPAKCPGNDGDFVFTEAASPRLHRHTNTHTYMHAYTQERERQADKLTNRQTILQWLSNKACSRKTAGKAGQKDMRLLLLARKCAEGKVTGGRRGGGAVKMRTRKNLEAQIKIISSCL